jgi:diketogulonate reductase-like aldo/keto reductase
MSTLHHEMPMIKLPNGVLVPALGQGTWRMGEDPAHKANEIKALRTGIDLGMTLIDTAEMYGSGKTERLVGDAIQGAREKVFLVSKVVPLHAGRLDLANACEGSLRRLRTDRLDLYLLHWRNGASLPSVVDGFERLREQGKIRSWGVSNFDLEDMEDLRKVPHGAEVATNQVLYNLMNRECEWALEPWCRARDIPLMAYTPFADGALLRHPAVIRVAEAHSATRAQVALAWLLNQHAVMVIPKASDARHARENRAAAELRLTTEDLNQLERAFPPPRRATSLKVA